MMHLSFSLSLFSEHDTASAYECASLLLVPSFQKEKGAVEGYVDDLFSSHLSVSFRKTNLQ